MKRIIFTTTLLSLFLSVGIVGCNDKESPCENYTEQEKAKSYEWAVGEFGSRESCKILKQAEHYKISELDEKANYKYEPEEGFLGSDIVEIETETSSEDGLTGYITVYKIEFTVTQCGLKAKKIIKETQDVKYQKGIVWEIIPDLCGKDKIKIKDNYFPTKNLPNKFKIDGLKVLVNFTITEEKKHCGFIGFKHFIFINRIKKDIE